jgi:hypothetical protein
VLVRGTVHLTLYVPGLFGPEAAYSSELVPRAPCLEILLGRADRRERPRRGHHETLAGLFGLAADEIPVAALMRHAGHASVDGYWMRADPVYLAADQRGLVLAGTGGMALEEEEAAALAAELAPLFDGMGATLHRDSPGDWYLHVASPPAISTSEPDAARGRDLLELLPRGPDAARWHRLLNEIQMSLHASAVNRRREQLGKPPVNSLWFWGGGALPREALPRRWSCVAGEGAFIEGLARLARTPHVALPGNAVSLSAGAGDTVLAVPDVLLDPAARGDLEGWSRGVQALERDWFAPCRQLLRKNVLGRLTIVTDRFAFSLSRAGALRFWRRALPLTRFARGAH